MADGYERYTTSDGNSSFLMGLLTGAAIGAGLGLLFAPKPGAELRGQLSEQAGNLANTAAQGYRRATRTASQLADRGRDLYDKAGNIVSRAAGDARDAIDDARGFASDAASNIGGSIDTARRG